MVASLGAKVKKKAPALRGARVEVGQLESVAVEAPEEEFGSAPDEHDTSDNTGDIPGKVRNQCEEGSGKTRKPD